ncbi:MAG TPA: PD-(D/E)XK nuclease family protein, partial [Planctomycetota bacterium]|nr:PD-(D/E)XK nuclease family protein [Planctomycetota bacterium]
MVEEGHPQAPRITRDAEWYDANPHARMSFSRLATYERCPAWFRHQYLDWHRTWELPVLRAGHLVQNALERVFDSEPAADVTLESLQERARGRF